MAKILISAILVISVATGCSDGRPARVPVSGQVLIDNQPLRYGSIRFVPAQGRSSAGKLDENGRFTLSCFDRDDGALVGTHRIEIAACQSLGPTKTRWHAPKKYASYHTSGITQEIIEPTESLLINLTWNGGGPFVEQLESDEGGPRQRKLSRK